MKRSVEDRTVETREVERTPVRRKPNHILGGFHIKTRAPEREGYYRRWVVDRPGRIEDAQASGYSFVVDPGAEIGDKPDDIAKRQGLDSRLSIRVGTHQDNTPMMAYLMETPKDWYQENQQIKEGFLKEKERSSNQNTEGWSAADQQNQYIPGKLNK
jgi:hypothetical protein